jgi:hypothetical protein
VLIFLISEVIGVTVIVTSIDVFINTGKDRLMIKLLSAH